MPPKKPDFKMLFSAAGTGKTPNPKRKRNKSGKVAFPAAVTGGEYFKKPIFRILSTSLALCLVVYTTTIYVMLHLQSLRTTKI